MTTAVPEEARRRRPVPWHRMAWVVWRQQQGTGVSIVGAFGVAALAVWLVGLHLHQTYPAVAACHPATATACQDAMMQFATPQTALLPVLLQVIAPLIGAFAGAPLLAREFETGTFRYAWTQGFGRARWAAAQLLPLAVLIAAAGVAFGQLVGWAYHPLVEAHVQSPLAATFFDLRGVDPAAWTVLAFALGALLGALIRRVMPAILATLAIWIALAVVTASLLRSRYAVPMHTIGQPGPLAWILTKQWTRHGRPVTLATLNHALQPIGAHLSSPLGFEVTTTTNASGVERSTSSASYILPYLTHHGFELWTIYQPVHRFGLFQAIEGTWVLGLALLLLAAVVWRVRRRTG